MASSSALQSTTKKFGRLLAGKVVRVKTIGVNDQPIVHVNIARHQFDKYLNMYFTKADQFWAVNTKNQAELGDFVLIRDREWRYARDVGHDVEKVLHKYGEVQDPITGRTGYASRGLSESLDVFGDVSDLRSAHINQTLGKPDYHIKTAVKEDEVSDKIDDDDFSVS